MPNETRNVAVVIGVGDATPLPYLGGAVNGARRFSAWAKALGYETVTLVDADEEVTITNLRLALEQILVPIAQPAAPIKRFLIYFAGHGLIREAEEGLWLLSDWNKELRAVAIEVLKRRLYMYGVAQIAIFADACRNLPADIQVSDLVPDSVLGRGPIAKPTTPAIDKFIAAQDGATTFMVPGRTTEEDRCLFSGVLMEGLWGLKPAAYSKLVPGCVTSSSLGQFLKSEVPAVAHNYKWTLDPTVLPAFPEDDNIYFGTPPKPPAPAFEAWRPASELLGMGVGTVAVEIQSFKPRAKPSRSQSPPTGVLDRLRRQAIPNSFETRSGFAVEGAIVRRLWLQKGFHGGISGRPDWWRVGHADASFLDRPASVLIEFDDGLCAATVALPGFVASLLRDTRGVSAIVYRRIGEDSRAAEEAEEALAALDAGSLRVSDAADMALGLRRGKHADPVQGVLSAYLYDSIADTDGIRQIAYYYCKRRQPIPFDVAMLAQISLEQREGLLWARVPEVQARMPRTRAERSVRWAYRKTEPASGVIGGLWPMMRQGWAFLDDPADADLANLSPGLVELQPMLTPGRFTTFNSAGGRTLAQLFEFEPSN